MSVPLTDLEIGVLDAALAAAGELGIALAAQRSAARALTRTPSGVGFVTRLVVPEGLRLSDRQADDGLPAVRGEHPQLPGGAEFVLQIKNGRLNSIEAFCYEGLWPADESLFRLRVEA